MTLDEMIRLRNKGLGPFCKQPIRITDYRDKLSWEEAKISGLCQRCQDEIFGKEE